MNNQTFAIIKPDAVRNGYSGKIIDIMINSDFKILGLKLIRMTKSQAEGFYEIHKDKPFFSELTDFMSSGKCVVIALQKEDAVNKWRELIGATDPAEADEGTIRKDYASSLGENAVHGADSNENAAREILDQANETNVNFKVEQSLHSENIEKEVAGLQNTPLEKSSADKALKRRRKFNRRTHVTLRAFSILVNSGFTDSSKHEFLKRHVETILNQRENLIKQCGKVKLNSITPVDDVKRETKKEENHEPKKCEHGLLQRVT